MPSWPLPSTRTGTALASPVVIPRMPAMNVRVCMSPRRIVNSSVACWPRLPMKMFLLPVVDVFPARMPIAMFELPVFCANARLPTAVLLLPAVVACRAPAPTAVF